MIFLEISFLADRERKKGKNNKSVACQQDGIHGEDATGWAQAAEARLRRALGSHFTSFTRDEKTLAE